MAHAITCRTCKDTGSVANPAYPEGEARYAYPVNSGGEPLDHRGKVIMARVACGCGFVRPPLTTREVAFAEAGVLSYEQRVSSAARGFVPAVAA